MDQSAPEKGTEKPKARFARKRELVVDAASGIVNDKGVAGLTFAEVAERVGLSTSSVTYYFRLKEQLAAAAFEKSLGRIESLVSRAAREPDPRSRVRKYVHMYFDLHADIHRGREQPITILSEMRALDDSIREPLRQHYSAIFRKIREFFGEPESELHQAINTARAQHLAEAMYWLPVWLFDYSYGDFGRVRDRMLDLFDRGLAVEGAPWEPLPMPSNVDRGLPQAQADFLRVATKLISERGHRGASVDRIASELKVTKGSFYHHLEAKEDLVLSCFRYSYARLAAAQKYAPGKTHWQRLTSTIVRLLQIQLGGASPLMRTTAIQTLPNEVRAAVFSRSNRAALRFSGTIIDGIAEGTIRAVDPLIAGQVMLSSLNAAYELHNWAERRGDLQQAIRLYAAALVFGLFDNRAIEWAKQPDRVAGTGTAG